MTRNDDSYSTSGSETGFQSTLEYSIVEALSNYVCAIQGDGEILYVNRPWRQVADSNHNSLLHGVHVGENYLDHCRSQYHNGFSGAAVEGILSIMNAQQELFELEYFCPACDHQAWFVLRVTPIVWQGKRGAVISHTDITNLVQQRTWDTTARMDADRQQKFLQEVRDLEALGKPASTAVTSRTFGIMPLDEALPESFDELFRQYIHILDQSVERRSYKVSHDVSGSLRALAEVLGFLNATPRDVIRIHTQVLKEKIQTLKSPMAQVYNDEGRMVCLELMGYLALYYRKNAMGIMTKPLPIQVNLEESHGKG